MAGVWLLSKLAAGIGTMPIGFFLLSLIAIELGYNYIYRCTKVFWGVFITNMSAVCILHRLHH